MTEVDKATLVRQNFFKWFSGNPVFVKAPGRINLAGEHLDYNYGFVLPAAINRHVYFAVAPNSEATRMRFYSVDYDEYFETNSKSLMPVDKHWSNYLSGVTQMLQMYCGQTFTGFDCVFGGDLPRGAGLSSSAAIMCGLALALCKIFKIEIDKMQLAQLCMKAENEFAGVQCGLLDPFAILFGKKNQVMSLDCKSLNYRYIPFQFPEYSILLFNTNKSHSLAGSDEFNKRVASCTKGLAAIQIENPSIDVLCNVGLSQLNKASHYLDDISMQRCTYVVEESIRYKKAIEALELQDLKTFASLLFQTHEGLKNKYKISCAELDLLIDYAQKSDSIYGSKLTGGGYGGCTLNIASKSRTEQITQQVSEFYNSHTGYKLEVYEFEPGDGAEFY